MKVRSASCLVFSLANIALFVSCNGKSAADLGADNSIAIKRNLSKIETPSLIHDFGIILPGSKLTHTFTVRNTTKSPWTLDRVVSSCRCATAHLPWAILNPESKEAVEVQYTAPSSSLSDEKTIELHFKEPNIPPLFITVRAVSRAPLFVSDRELLLQGEGIVRANLLVANYSSDHWKNIDVKSDAPWLLLDIIPADIKDRGAIAESAKQAWRVGVVVNTNTMPRGSNRCFISIESSEKSASWRETVTVRVIERPVIELIPSKVFFGDVQPGKTLTRRLLVRLSPNFLSNLNHISKWQVVYDPISPRLTHRWAQLSDTLFALDLSFTPDVGEEFFATYIRIAIADSIPVQVVPIAAHIRSPGD